VDIGTAGTRWDTGTFRDTRDTGTVGQALVLMATGIGFEIRERILKDDSS